MNHIDGTCIDCRKKLSRKKYKRCRKCYVKYNKINNHPSWTGGKPKCEDCGKEINYGSKRCNNCSRKYVVGKHHPQWSGGMPKCKDCGKQLGNYLSTRCHNCKFKLNKHPNWRGGISFEPYPLGWNKTFKEQIRYRDGYKCQLCNIPEVECNCKLHVHHKDYNKMNIKPENLTSLCRSCHMKTNFNRDYWIKYYKLEEMQHA